LVFETSMTQRKGRAFCSRSKGNLIFNTVVSEVNRSELAYDHADPRPDLEQPSNFSNISTQT
jgi:hypothetical protein